MHFSVIINYPESRTKNQALQNIVCIESCLIVFTQNIIERNIKIRVLSLNSLEKSQYSNENVYILFLIKVKN